MGEPSTISIFKLNCPFPSSVLYLNKIFLTWKLNCFFPPHLQKITSKAVPVWRLESSSLASNTVKRGSTSVFVRGSLKRRFNFSQTEFGLQTKSHEQTASVWVAFQENNQELQVLQKRMSLFEYFLFYTRATFLCATFWHIAFILQFKYFLHFPRILFCHFIFYIASNCGSRCTFWLPRESVVSALSRGGTNGQQTQF